MTRTGKIARLPHHLREALNLRLADNIPGREITGWLNSHPEAQTILNGHFGGDLINQQNLSNWRRGGFLEWQTRQEFFDRLQDLTESSADIDAALPATLTEHAARLLSAHIALLLSPSPNSPFNALWSMDADPEPSSAPAISNAPSSLHLVKPLCALTRAVTTLRRNELKAVHPLQNHAPARHHAEEPPAETTASAPPPDIAAAPAPEPEIKPVKASSSPLVPPVPRVITSLSPLPALVGSPHFSSNPLARSSDTGFQPVRVQAPLVSRLMAKTARPLSLRAVRNTG